jgi:hypothetical protein
MNPLYNLVILSAPVQTNNTAVMRRHAVALVSLVVALPVWLAAQPAFRSSVEVVTVPGTIAGDRRPLPRAELMPDDFRLFEDGVAQEIAMLVRERPPTSLCFVMDASGSMGGMRQRHAAAAVQRAVNNLDREDEFAVVVFTGTPIVAVNWTSASRRDGLRWDLGADGFTSLTDAMAMTLRMMDQAAHSSRVHQRTPGSTA